MRWANESAFDAEIAAAVAAASIVPGVAIPTSLVKAIIAVESRFNPRAYRAEVKIGDASRGLMQLLLKTARGTGFMGVAEDLYSPRVNTLLGVRYLADLTRSHGGDLVAAVSAYNNGHGKRATARAAVCLARDAQGRCVQSFTAEPGQYFNQPYVDKVLEAWRYFEPGAGLLPIVALGAAFYLTTRA